VKEKKVDIPKRIFFVLTALWLLSANMQAGFTSDMGGFHLSRRKFLPPSQAFKAEARLEGKAIHATITLGEKIHIYAKDLRFRIIAPKIFELDVKKPAPVKYENRDVYYGRLDFKIPLDEIYPKTVSGFTLEISMTGCSDEGVCYAPRKFTFEFPAVAVAQSAKSRNGDSGRRTGNAVTYGNPDHNPEPETGKGIPEKSEGLFSRISRLTGEGNSGKIAQTLAKEGIVFVLLLFFVAGLLLALTPCILPMIPILSSIIVRQAGKEGGVSRSASFLISLVYVVAMAATYALVGIVAGLMGFDLQAQMNNPWIILPMAAIFVALAFSLFGYFELGLPSSWQSRLTRASDNARGKGLLGTAVMGSISALIVGTCTAPVISGAILFISMTGDALLGGLSLFVMGIGAGMPLLLVGAGADRLIPRPGGWMTRVSQIFGAAMLAMAIYILRGILDPFWFLTLMGMLFMGSALYMGVFEGVGQQRGTSLIFRLLAWLLLLYGSLLFVGAVGGAESLLDPLAPFGTKNVTNSKTIPMGQNRDYTLERLRKEIADAAAEGKPVVVDICRENCSACSELEHITFKNQKVLKEMKRFRFIRIDITANTPGERDILRHYRLFGAPNILFFDSDGNPLPEKFLTGFVKPEIFVKYLKSVR
jgi:thiol:disulfide interchange protein DsbD